LKQSSDNLSHHHVDPYSNNKPRAPQQPPSHRQSPSSQQHHSTLIDSEDVEDGLRIPSPATVSGGGNKENRELNPEDFVKEKAKPNHYRRSVDNTSAIRAELNKAFNEQCNFFVFESKFQV
jgi:hypothetical protein